ncbi:MAG: hypothetical protein K2H35_00485 [Muribaculaceae bacterium]|nr:hypothetical protein [Muribaculaceae bacterium]
MKFKIVGGLLMAAAAGMILTSCLGEPKNDYSFSIKVSNLIIPDDLNSEIQVSHGCTYSLKVDGVKNKIAVSTTTLAMNGSSNLTFASNPMDGLVLSGYGSESATFARGTAKLSNGKEVTDINGFYTSIVNYYELAGDPFPMAVVRPMLVMNYRVGDTTIYTFSPDSFFSGSTTTTYSLGEGAPEKHFTTKDAVYRVKFAENMKTATLVLYNIQFAEEMGVKLAAVVLKDLPVTLCKDGYVISAQNVVPEMFDDSGLTPMPRYIFNNIVVETPNPTLTDIKCDYTVAGAFKGVFEGQCVNKFEVSAK